MLCFTSFRFSFHIIIAWSLISEWRVRQRSCAIWPTAPKVDSMKMKYCSKIYKKIMTKMYFKLRKLVVFKHRQITVETIECTKTNNDIIDSDEMLLALDSNTRYSQFPSVGSFTSLSIEQWVQGNLWLYVTCNWQACWDIADEGHLKILGSPPWDRTRDLQRSRRMT